MAASIPTTSAGRTGTLRQQHNKTNSMRLLTQNGFNALPLRTSSAPQRRRQQAVVQAASGGPAYNKYRSRKDIEKDYYKEWERTTLIAEEELNRPMTPVTFLTFLPTWFRFYGLPGPVRYLCYLIYQRLAAVAHIIHKKMVIQGAKFDAGLLKRSSTTGATFPPRSLVMLRYHYRIPFMENLKYRLALLNGQNYQPKPLPTHEELVSLPYHLRDPLTSSYDSTADPWVAS